ncbi:hypothetical protein IH799_05350 [candidate division KSB1 bacterium]|nr:hypothetical protein [candidate division KSB1 bacterium]
MNTRMQMVYWKSDEFWLGKLLEHPEIMTQGKTLEEALSEMVMVAEGVKTTRSAYELAAQHEVEVPIITEAHKVLFQDKDPKQAVYDLMTRAAKSEDWG